MAEYKFPQVDFSIIGDLPQTMEEARLRGVRRSLGDINANTPQGLQEAGSRLVAGGDLEGGIKLINAGTALKSANQRGLSDLLNLELYKKLGGIKTQEGTGIGGYVPPASPDETPPVATPPPSGNIAPPAAPWPGRPGASLPPPQTVAMAPLSPEDTRISPALAPPPPVPPQATALAQAGQSPFVPAPAPEQSPPEPSPPTGLPPTVQGFNPAFTVEQPRPPGAAAPSAPPAGAPTTTLTAPRGVTSSLEDPAALRAEMDKTFNRAAAEGAANKGRVSPATM